jgi:hypothetical protein
MSVFRRLISTPSRGKDWPILVGATRLCQGYAGQAGHSFETDTAPIEPFVSAFCGPSEPHLLTATRLGREPLLEFAAAHSE